MKPDFITAKERVRGYDELSPLYGKSLPEWTYKWFLVAAFFLVGLVI